MRNDIIFSIIIPVYNSERYISACIKSIISCRNDNIEIILIDDGSNDDSYKICKEYAKKDKRIKILHKRNEGASSARNKGIEEANGKYIMFVDSDDILDDNWDRILDSKMEKDIYYINENIDIGVSKLEMLNYIIGFNNKKICFAGPFSKIFKTSFLKKNKISFKDEIINGEDMLFNVEALLNCSSFEIINDSYYRYRNYQGSATKRFDKKIIQSDKNFQKELYNILSCSDIESKLRNNICLYCTQMAIILILNRIAYIKSYRKAKKYFEFLETEPYRIAIHKRLKINKKYNIIFLFIKYNLYYIIYRSLRMIVLVKNNKRKKKYLIKI